MEPRHRIPQTRRERVRSMLWTAVAILFGWTLFVYWWIRVLSDDEARSLFSSLVFIALCSLLFIAITVLWIWHNVRISEHGRRGTTTRYQIPRFERDGVGRQIVLPPDANVQRAPIITVNATAETKLYSAQEGPAS